MYAYFVPTGHRKLRLWQETVLGMPLLRVELPARVTPRRQRTLERCLARCRVHRVLNLPQGWRAESLPPLNETRPLWHQKALELSLRLLEQQGLRPAEATVEVCGDRFTQQQRQFILALLPRVRALTLSLPVDEAFLWHLQREYGVCPLSGPGDLAVCFSPAARKMTLPLWAPRPGVAGLRLTARLEERSEDCPEEPLLSALVQQGRLGAEQIKICTNFS